MKQKMIICVNDSIALRQIELTDATAVFNTINSHREYFRKWLPFVDYTKTVADSAGFIESIYAVLPERQELVFVILYNHQLVGLAGFKDTDRVNRKTEIGYWLSAEYQGLGIMTRSVQRLLEYAFETQNMNRVQIKCAVGNTASIKIPRRLHFQFEGVERAGELSSDGDFFDLEVYSMLKKKYDINSLQ